MPDAPASRSTPAAGPTPTVSPTPAADPSPGADPTAATAWIDGFSRLAKAAKREWVAERYGRDPAALLLRLRRFDQADAALQERLDGFAENTVANYPLPLGIAPNFVIDGRMYAVPMAIEESSVVAAAAMAAKYWGRRGGIATEVLGTEKVGQVFFRYPGDFDALRAALPGIERELRAASAPHTRNMEARGGGVLRVELLRAGGAAELIELRGHFDTRDSMGANFVNTVLEAWAAALPEAFARALPGHAEADAPEVLMAILSNYTPGCVVRAEVGCGVDDLGAGAGGHSALEVARRFRDAVALARDNPYRAVTHNKGIFNGVDAVVLATGNDFRAVEAAGHAYASRDGQYRSLSTCTLDGDRFGFALELPLALGTVGGLTRGHPLAAAALEVLGDPDAAELMRVVAAVGLAQNFAAVRSLVTTGIQSGHMRMHLRNILTALGADPAQRSAAAAHFAQRAVTVAGVREFLAGAAR